MSTRQHNELDGVLLVDKPMDWTSQDAVSCIRSRFNLGKVGHCGTLDPMATGLLVIIIGKATKLQERLMADSKIYDGTMTLGRESDTEDSTGNITAEKDPASVTEDALRAAFARFVGDISQVPPMHSAVKRNGRPLYALARKGIVVERKPRRVSIHAFELLRFATPEADFRVHCSKGTYIRTLCADVGRALGCGALMSALRRTGCGTFRVDAAVTMERIKSWELEDLRGAIISPEQALAAADAQG